MITLTIKDTPAGVVIDAAGPLHAIGDAPWVARTLIEHAAPLFVGGKPVLLGGEADPVRGIEVIEHFQEKIDLRGILAGRLKCWHRLTGEESQELVDLVSGAASLEPDEHEFWFRICEGLDECKRRASQS
jgi:hypothetical protein